MDMDSIFAHAIRALFLLGNDLFGLADLASSRRLTENNARLTVEQMRERVAVVTAAIDRIERQLEETKGRMR